SRSRRSSLRKPLRWSRSAQCRSRAQQHRNVSSSCSPRWWGRREFYGWVVNTTWPSRNRCETPALPSRGARPKVTEAARGGHCEQMDMTSDDREHFRELGYVVLRGVIDASALRRELEQSLVDAYGANRPVYKGSAGIRYRAVPMMGAN